MHTHQPYDGTRGMSDKVAVLSASHNLQTALLLQLIQLTAVELALDASSKTAQMFSASKALKQHLIGALRKDSTPHTTDDHGMRSSLLYP